VDKWGRHGEPEDYESWCDQAPLRGPLVEGLLYEIVPRLSPGRTKPSERRTSVDFTTVARGGSHVSVPPEGWSPRPLLPMDDEVRPIQKWHPTRPIPPQ
jgi:hypothetical protein